MQFLVDESMGNKFAALLKESGHDTIFAGNILPEAVDVDVLSFAEREKRVLITSDKDFGKLAVQLGRPATGVILFRTLTRDPAKRVELAKGALEKAAGAFVVIEEGRIRVRRLKQ